MRSSGDAEQGCFVMRLVVHAPLEDGVIDPGGGSKQSHRRGYRFSRLGGGFNAVELGFAWVFDRVVARSFSHRDG